MLDRIETALRHTVENRAEAGEADAELAARVTAAMVREMARVVWGVLDEFGANDDVTLERWENEGGTGARPEE